MRHPTLPAVCQSVFPAYRTGTATLSFLLIGSLEWACSIPRTQRRRDNRTLIAVAAAAASNYRLRIVSRGYSHFRNAARPSVRPSVGGKSATSNYCPHCIRREALRRRRPCDALRRRRRRRRRCRRRPREKRNDNVNLHANFSPPLSGEACGAEVASGLAAEAETGCLGAF